MNNLKHTPGPWRAEENEDDTEYLRLPYFYIQKENYCIAEIHNSDSIDYQQINANAHLIAAAPEMLEALIKAIQVIKLWHGDEVFDIYLNKSPEMKSIREAVEAATGMRIEEAIKS